MSIEISGWNDPIGKQYGVNSIPKIMVLNPANASAIGEIPWSTYGGDITKLKQQLKSAATWKAK
ncbi:MAG TPA: hypothetical protein PL110_21440 [Candidatus Eremiobacteraeota bacterium]|nr:MAG: hypothetical protein BWY64_02768 [bacterium ADurb.Bin363]HPZ10668.1 hypothetical protein [Candidatus Eremiobacteraeota bacterium]